MTSFSKKFRLHKGDPILVVSGNHKGAEGEVIRLDRLKNRVAVAGAKIGKVQRRVKPKSKGEEGVTENKDVYIHISNVMFFDKKLRAVTKVGFKRDADGNLQRFSKKTGDLIK